MNTLLVLLTVILAGSILYTECFEIDERLPEILQEEVDEIEIVTHRPKLVHKLRRKRDDAKHHYCGPVLNKKMAEVCNNCSRNPNTNAIKRKRDLSPFLEQKIRTKREQGIATQCCKHGCSVADLKGFCC